MLKILLIRLSVIYKDTFDNNEDSSINNVNVVFEDGSIDIQEDNTNKAT